MSDAKIVDAEYERIVAKMFNVYWEKSILGQHSAAEAESAFMRGVKGARLARKNALGLLHEISVDNAEVEADKS